MRKVKLHGEVSYLGKRWFLTELLCGERFDLLKTRKKMVQVYYYILPIAKPNLSTGKVERNDCQKKGNTRKCYQRKS